MEEEQLTIQTFKSMSIADRKKVKKEALMNLILSSELSDTSDLTTAIKGLTEMVAEYKKETQENSQKIIELKVEVELLKNENRQIKTDFASRLNNLEQRSRIKNLEIVGLKKPTALETDTSLTLGFLKDVMKAEIDISDVDVIHEVPTKRKDKKRVVVVALKHRCKRDEILKLRPNVREYNKGHEQENRIFVNEQLSPENRKIFALCSKRRIELGFKFHWTKNGVSFLKKDVDSELFKVSCEEDLLKLN